MATPEHLTPAAELAALVREVSALAEGGRPWCAGAVVLAGRGPGVLVRHTTGWAVRYAARGRERARADWVPMRADTLFDLASLTKLFTAVATVQQAERGALALDGPAADHVPEFAAAGKAAVTVRQLLTHTSGLRPELPFHDGGGLGLLWREVPVTEPGSTYRYSDLNFLALQQVLERVTGQRLDVLVRDGITAPLGMDDTRYGPVPAAGAAATEDQRRPWAKADRGLLRGEVHDENAHALGGIAGHAGLFSTAGDLGRLCRALLAGGPPLLTPESAALLLDPPGLGFAVDQPYFMGELAGHGAAGHTGFTGTSLVLDRHTGGYLVLLANTVHPVRPRRPDSTPRARAATRLARALR
ncbi:serine hydrolase [Streptomyces sp. ACA25]|uniref:serine hydrolase domain-containing protein n=1 Tax=Streptomyces sp. ACA25 TaxID=3022596 RepID=UPI002307325A|nr:serine hydrolase domain-containing protein [Streptomyces sp. ACA25]MDB1087805.1 serine hydrolase [Streptomyces sp. ACA25]